MPTKQQLKERPGSFQRSLGRTRNTADASPCCSAAACRRAPGSRTAALPLESSKVGGKGDERQRRERRSPRACGCSACEGWERGTLPGLRRDWRCPVQTLCPQCRGKWV